MLHASTCTLEKTNTPLTKKLTHFLVETKTQLYHTTPASNSRWQENRAPLSSHSLYNQAQVEFNIEKKRIFWHATLKSLVCKLISGNYIYDKRRLLEEKTIAYRYE